MFQKMLFYNYSYLAMLFLFSSIFYSYNAQSHDDEKYITTYSDFENGLLIASTLEGFLIALDQKTGRTKWTIKNEPAVKVVMKHKSLVSPVFLPDPRDGSLYLLNTEEKNGLTKLPFSIQQLVADSPTRSQDGIFYFGRKSDSWISIDNVTGEKNVLSSTEEFERVCPVLASNVFFIGRTEYNLALIDSKRNNNNWNITYFDYSARSLTNEQMKDYDYVHIAESSSGRVRTFKRNTGVLLWERDFGSPMVSLYLQWGKDIFNLPFTSAAEVSFDSLPSEKMQATLFIGEHNFGYYALPSFASAGTPIQKDILPSRYLLGGPENGDSYYYSLSPGHYKIPNTPKIPLRITGKPKATRVIHEDLLNSSVATPESNDQVVYYISPESKIFGVIIAVIVASFGGILIYLFRQVKEIKQSSQGSGQVLNGYSIYDEQKGIVTVGKISFDTRKVLGKGCEGTFVFRGKFDGRDVAVKRLLPECFTIADREVQLLRESDSHSNVIRYFSTEQDNQFRYIALELCAATLQDYVEKGVYKENINHVDILKQATSGIEHLHSLKIVHRDIKPHNILLAFGNNETKVRAMISDFGLCKKLPHGKNSFSRKSGITGTDGWIAPEMMNSTGRMMSAVDIFSLGCVFYYTISGAHPFGDVLRRQSNILLGEFKLPHISCELWRVLIIKMISPVPSDRPSAVIVKNHPVFWSKTTILTFLQDVSDRVDKENLDSEVLLELEKGGDLLHGRDWKASIDMEIAEDIGKYRTYRGDSVRDLLRALRNKRHHYRDLTLAAQEILGVSAESYINYWLTRFPRLLFHVWSSMQIIRSEPSFIQYYYENYTFPSDKSEFVPQWLNDLKVWESSFTNKKMRNSPHHKKKYKCDKVPQDDCDVQMKNDWIKSGEKTGAWRPRKYQKDLQEKNITWKLPS